MGTKKSYTVKILDQDFSISSDASPERVEKIAEYVNSSMKQVLSKTKRPNPMNTAVLTALNIAERYFEVLEKHSEFKARVLEKSNRVLHHLDSLDDSAGGAS
jgi:cell division protein ZapA